MRHPWLPALGLAIVAAAAIVAGVVAPAIGAGSLELSRAEVKTVRRAGLDFWGATGAVTVVDNFTFLQEATESGLFVSIDDSSASGAFAGDSVAFTGEDCTLTTGGGVTCTREGSKVRMRPSRRSPGTYVAAIRIRDRDFDTPSVEDGPLVVEMVSKSQLNASQAVSPCRLVAAGTKLLCKR